MEAPKEIYVAFQYHPKDKSTSCHASIEKTTHPREEKYIRADLAELTWGDIKKIELLLFAIECSSARPYRGEDLYKEVLRRFLENKRK